MRESSALVRLPTTSATRAPTTFHLFPELTFEIRLKIWNLAVPMPVIIELYEQTQGQARRPRLAPAILQVCQETRDGYLPRTPATLTYVDKEARQLLPSFFARDVDTMVIKSVWDLLLRRTSPDLCSKVRFLAMHWHTTTDASSEINVLRHFPSLEEFTASMTTPLMEGSCGEISRNMVKTEVKLVEAFEKAERANAGDNFHVLSIRASADFMANPRVRLLRFGIAIAG